MCQQQRLGFSFKNLEKRGAIEIEELANPALGDFNLVIDPVGGKIYEQRRNISQQSFKR